MTGDKEQRNLVNNLTCEKEGETSERGLIHAQAFATAESEALHHRLHPRLKQLVELRCELVNARTLLVIPTVSHVD